MQLFQLIHIVIIRQILYQPVGKVDVGGVNVGEGYDLASFEG